MKSTDRLHIKGLDMVKDEMETITFSQFMHEMGFDYIMPNDLDLDLKSYNNRKKIGKNKYEKDHKLE